MNAKLANFKQGAAKMVALFLVASMLGTGNAQQAPALSKHAVKIKAAVEALTQDARISVIRSQGLEEYGKFQSHDEVGFSFYDVDIHKNVTLSYEEVRKIKNGYGGYNHVTGRHTDRGKRVLITAIFLGALLGGMVALVASQKD